MTRFIVRSFLAAAVIATLGIAGVARAATATWTAGGSNNNWNNSANWSFSPACAGCVPGPNDDVVADNSSGANVRIDINVSVDVKSITTQNGFSRAINFAAGTTDTMRVRGNVTLNGGGNFDCMTATTQIDGNVTVGNSETFNMNGGTVTINGTFTQTGGTVNGMTGTVTIGGSVSVSGGNFNGSSGLLIIGGTLNLPAGGSFRASSATTRIGGAFNDTGGSYSDNGGLLLFTAKTDQTHTFGGSTFKKATFNDGMPGYWNFDEASGTTVNDNSGYINVGTSTNMTWGTTSGPGLAFANTSYGTFNGSSSRVALTVTQLPSANAAQSISAWIKINALPASASSIVAMTGTASAVKLGLSPTLLRVLRNDGTALISTTAPSTGTWHHVAYTWSGTSNNLFVDGVAVTATATAHDSAAVTAAFIGATSAAADFFNGSIDEVRIHDRALTATEVSSLALGRTGGTSIATHTFSDPYLATVGANVADLVIASGTVTGSSTINVEGSWWNYGGRFTGTGTVTLQSASTESLLSGGSTFSTLVINRNGDNYNLVDRLWIPNGTFTLTAGRISLNSYTMHVGSMSLTGTTFTPGTGTVVIDSASNQTLPSSILTAYSGLRLEDSTETSLVGYWKLDEGVSMWTRDWSGTGNIGGLSTGVTWTSPCPSIGFDNAGAASFNGTIGYLPIVTTTGLPAANAAQTISAWVNITALPGSASSIFAMTGSASAVKLGLSPTLLRVLRNDGTALISTTAPSTGTWHHVAYTWNGSSNNLYVDGVAVSPTATSHDTAAVTAATIGASPTPADFFNGKIDDVRVYSAALTATQVAQLAAGRYAGTGGYATYTLGANTTVSSTFAIDAANFTSSTFTFGATAAAAPAALNTGTYTVGSATQSFTGGLTVQPAGTLTMATSGGTVAVAAGTTLTMDGTLNASSTGAVIKNGGSGTYTFSVGSTASARPTLNITGLSVQNTDSNGMQINVNHAAVTTFTRFDNLVFTSGTGKFLNIYATALYLPSSGVRFGITTGGASDATLPTNNVVLTGNGTADGDTRIVFGSATCAAAKTTSGYCQTAWKSDDDADNNGVGDNPGTNGAVVQYVRGVGTDVAGSIEGFPTAAFDWNTGAYYSTYVAYHDTSGTADTIYVRDQAGAAKYQWNTPSGETIVGTPKWMTISSAHYVFVGLASGKVYRLIDNGTTLTPYTAGNWAGANNPFNCSCTIVTPLATDTSNVYFGGTVGSTQNIYTLGQTSRALANNMGFPITPVITSASPSTWTSGNKTYLFMGLTGNAIQFDGAGQAITATNTNPGSAAIRGRVLPTVINRVFFGDDGGTMWAVDSNNFGGTNKLWSYVVSGDSIRSSPYYDYTGTTLHFGTEAGKVIALNSSGAALTGYPYVPGTTSDSIRSALLYSSGILLVGTTTGKLFVINRMNGASGPSLIRLYYFGPTESVSGIGYDSNSNRYMVSTADPSTNDGRLYYIDSITDPDGTL